MPTPLLSVVLPSYNYGRFLPKCLAGLMSQTFTDFEIVVTDDGSTDGSQKIIKEYATRDSRFRPNYFPENRGPEAAFLDISNRAQGKYIYCYSSDDFIISADFFKKAITALEKDPRPAGFYGICGIYVSEKEALSGAMGTAEVEGYNTPLQCAQGFLKCRSVISGLSCLWRREPFMRLAGDMPTLLRDLGPQMDFFLFHALAFVYGVHYEKTPFACQRIYEARTNYSANLQLWETARRYAGTEQRLRPLCQQYAEIESDWSRWRAYWMMDVIRKSGVKV